MAMKIVLVDDQPVPGLTLRRWLRRQRDIEVVGEAVPGSPVLALIQLVEPDVVLLDLHTSPEAGLNVARMIREQYPNVPVVAIGEAAAASVRVEAAEAGAWAFFPKTRPEELARAIPSVIAGKGRRFLDLTERHFQRPVPDSFVALPENSGSRSAPEPRAQTPMAAPAAHSRIPGGATRRVPPVAAPKPPPAATAAVRPVPPLQPPPADRPKKASPTPKTAAAGAPRAPEKAVKPPAPPERARRNRQSQGNGAAESTFELRPDARAKATRDAVAWTHPALTPVSAETPQRKPRRRRGKREDEAPDSTELRGLTGLPRRFGGHR